MRTGCGATTGRTSKGGGTVRTLYEAAMREVRADPVAAVTKYQPNWLDGLSPQRPHGPAPRAGRPAKG